MYGGRGPVRAPRGHGNVSGMSNVGSVFWIVLFITFLLQDSRRTPCHQPGAGVSRVLCCVCGLEGRPGCGLCLHFRLSQLCPQGRHSVPDTEGRHSVSLTLTLMGALTPWDSAEAAHHVVFSKSPSRVLAGAALNILSAQALCSEAWSTSQLRPRASG